MADIQKNPDFIAKMDAQTAYLEQQVRENPSNKQAVMLLLKSLNTYIPEGKPQGPFTECQQILISEFGIDGLFKMGASLNDFARHYQRCETILESAGVRIPVAIGQLGLGQTVKINGVPMNCNLRLDLFNKRQVITKLCHSCYKVQILTTNLADHISTYFMLLRMELARDNHRKSMVEVRDNVINPYKAYIYCESEAEVKEIRELSNERLEDSGIRKVRCAITHGCSEFGIAYPEFKYSEDGAHRKFKRLGSWDRLETDYFRKNKLPNTPNSVARKHFVSIFRIVAFRTWIMYAQTIGDESYTVFDPNPRPDKTTHFFKAACAQSSRRYKELEELSKTL